MIEWMSLMVYFKFYFMLSHFVNPTENPSYAWVSRFICFVFVMDKLYETKKFWTPFYLFLISFEAKCQRYNDNNCHQFYIFHTTWRGKNSPSSISKFLEPKYLFQDILLNGCHCWMRLDSMDVSGEWSHWDSCFGSMVGYGDNCSMVANWSFLNHWRMVSFMNPDIGPIVMGEWGRPWIVIGWVGLWVSLVDGVIGSIGVIGLIRFIGESGHLLKGLLANWVW